MSDKITIGTCGNCGGAVCIPRMWWGINPPTPRCVNCGAEPIEAHGPVIPMKPAPKRGPNYWHGNS